LMPATPCLTCSSSVLSSSLLQRLPHAPTLPNARCSAHFISAPFASVPHLPRSLHLDAYPRLLDRAARRLPPSLPPHCECRELQRCGINSPPRSMSSLLPSSTLRRALHVCVWCDVPLPPFLYSLPFFTPSLSLLPPFLYSLPFFTPSLSLLPPFLYSIPLFAPSPPFTPSPLFAPSPLLRLSMPPLLSAGTCAASPPPSSPSSCSIEQTWAPTSSLSVNSQSAPPSPSCRLQSSPPLLAHHSAASLSSDFGHHPSRRSACSQSHSCTPRPRNLKHA
jgi:hypothetical protein